MKTLSVRLNFANNDYQLLLPEEDYYVWIVPDTLLPASAPSDFVRYDSDGNRIARDSAQVRDGTPAVNTTGELDNHKYSYSVKLLAREQWFHFDLLYGSAYGFMVGNLDEIMDRKFLAYPDLSRANTIAKCFTAMWGDSLWGANGTGFPDHDNHITGELTGDPLRADKVRAFCTDGWRYNPEDEVVNRHGWEMLRVPYFDIAGGENGIPNEWDLSILEDPRVGRCSNIYSKGSVGGFPNYGGVPLYTPIVWPRFARSDNPPFYPKWYVIIYRNSYRMPIGWNRETPPPQILPEM